MIAKITICKIFIWTTIWSYYDERFYFTFCNFFVQVLFDSRRIICHAPFTFISSNTVHKIKHWIFFWSIRFIKSSWKINISRFLSCFRSSIFIIFWCVRNSYYFTTLFICETIVFRFIYCARLFREFNRFNSHFTLIRFIISRFIRIKFYTDSYKITSIRGINCIFINLCTTFIITSKILKSSCTIPKISAFCNKI